MTTAAAWLALTTTSRQVLVTISNIRETQIGWTQVGATTAYSVSWASQTHSGQSKSAYRAITGVMINAVALTSRASLAAVQANASSWFWDSATNTLYASSASGASPATFSWTGAVFSLYFGSTAVADTVLYEPRVVGNLPTIRTEEYDLTLGVTSSSSGTLSLTNADGFFDDLAWKYAWHGATVALAVGGSDMAITDYLAAGQLQIAGAPAPADDICTCELRPFDNQAKTRVFPLHTYDDLNTAGLYPSFHFGRGDTELVPLWWGRVADAPARIVGQKIVVGPGPLLTFYHYLVFVDLIIDAAAVATAVRATDPQTGAVTNIAFTMEAGMVLVNQADGNWPASFRGYTVDAVRSTPVTVGAIAKEILLLLGVPTASIDTAAFAQADTDWPAELGIYAAGGDAPNAFTTCGELLRQCEQASLGRIFVGNDGRWTMTVYDPSVPLDAPVLEEERMTAFAPSSDIQEVTARGMLLRYAYNIGAKTWTATSVTQAAAAYKFQTLEALNYEAMLTEAHYAELLAARLAWMNSLPTTRVVLDGPPACFTRQPRDKVRVIRRRGPGTTGSWADPGVVMEVEAVAARPADCRAEVTIGNMRGIGGTVKRAAPNGTANWASASSIEKLFYGFALDNSTERADVSDASTYQQNRAW